MVDSIRWRIQDRHGNEIYLSQERWEHIIDLVNRPEMARFEEHLKRTICLGRRQQDSLNPQKYRYVLEFDDLEADNFTSLPSCCSGFGKKKVGLLFPTTTS